MTATRDDILRRLAAEEAERLNLHHRAVAMAIDGADDAILNDLAHQLAVKSQRIDVLSVALECAKTHSDSRIGPIDGPGWARVKVVAHRYGVSDQHVRDLILEEKVLGQKRDGAWLVWLESAERHFSARV